MNQFYNYKDRLSRNNTAYSIANDFDYILNNIWCKISFEKGKKKWREISYKIPEPYRFKIDIEIDHIWLEHGIDAARLAVKHEMENCIDFLLSDSKTEKQELIKFINQISRNEKVSFSKAMQILEQKVDRIIFKHSSYENNNK